MSPPIPERYSSLVPAARRGELETLNRRTVSAASDVSHASSTSEFVERKIDDVTASLEYVERLRSFLTEAFHDGQLEESQYTEALDDCLKNSRPKEQELVVLKRQKKIVREDLAEEAPQYAKIEDAYAAIITNKVMGASGRLGKKKMFNQGKFRANVMEYYGASRRNEVGDKQEYCHLSGWVLEGHVKAAHIVPKSLYSDEVSYLFGVGDAMLSEPRNGLTLRSQIEVGLDSGLIVLVPMPPKDGEETKWKCVLTDKTKRSNEAMPGWKWKDVDGKELVFLGANRPARRFLYLRFVVTYLHCKNANNLGWVSEVEAKGRMWASSGPYLRRSMLATLARKISDLYLPETFYTHTTFAEADGCASRGEEEEKDLVLSLSVRLHNEKEAAQAVAQTEDEDEDDSGDNSDVE